LRGPRANRISQSRSTNASNGETFSYDPLQRLTQAARTTGAAVNFGYSASGNLTKKDDFSTAAANAYSYASINSTTNGCGPHAANSVALPSGTATYQCDANGNVIGGDTITATFDADNHPRSLTRTNLGGGATYEPCATNHPDTIFCDGYEILPTQQTTGNATWAYDSNGNRYFETSALQGTRYFGPAGYEVANGTAKQELGPVIVTGNGTGVTVVLKDRLGSTLDTIDGSTLTQRAYAPFGAARNGDFSDRANGTLNLMPDTIHGFTNHTHEDDVALIHMNGRVFDPALGRFLSVDPLVQQPLNSQALNPYSYLLNNPMAGKDPTGYASTKDCERVQHCAEGNEGDGAAAQSDGKSPSAHGSRAGNGAVSQSENGAGGAKNAQAGAPDKMALTNAPTTKPGEQATTLDTIKVTATSSSFGSDVWNSIKTNFLLLIGGDEYESGTYNAFAPFGSVPTRQERLEAQRAQQQAQNPTASIVGSAIAALPMIVVPGEGEAAAGMEAESASLGIDFIPGRRTFSPADRAAGFEKSKDAFGVPRCAYCGTPLSPRAGSPNSYEADHATPYSRGGPSTFENLAPSCRTCNRSKGAQTPSEWKEQKDN
jgi:RHS repeat-associated protein